MKCIKCDRYISDFRTPCIDKDSKHEFKYDPEKLLNGEPDILGLDFGARSDGGKYAITEKSEMQRRD